MTAMSIRFPLIPNGLAFNSKDRGLPAFAAADSGIRVTGAKLPGTVRTASAVADPTRISSRSKSLPSHGS